MYRREFVKFTAFALALTFALGLAPLRSQADDGEDGTRREDCDFGESYNDEFSEECEFDEDEAEFIGYIVKLTDDSDADIPDGLTPIPYNEGMYVADTVLDVLPLICGGEVEFIAENAVIELLGGEGFFPLAEQEGQWQLDFLNIDDVWMDYPGSDGSGVKIAVVDSGLIHNHEDLDYSGISGWSSINSGVWDTDSTGHGTFVTGLIKAIPDNGIGIKGIASGADIIEARCMSDGEGTVADVLAAIGYVVESGADVINMSVGGNESHDLRVLLEPVIQNARDAGAILIAAAGNRTGGDVTLLPAGMDGVIGVGMLDTSGTVSNKSTQNSSVDITAPGIDLVSLNNNVSGTAYASGSGTSYAAPLIAALAALVRQADNGIDSDEFLELLKESAEDGGDAGYDTSYGWGKADAYKLMETLETPRKITYCRQDGTIITPQTDWITAYTILRDYDVDYSLPVPVFENEDFIGWYDNAEFTGTALTSVPTGIVGELTLYTRTPERLYVESEPEPEPSASETPKPDNRGGSSSSSSGGGGRTSDPSPSPEILPVPTTEPELTSDGSGIYESMVFSDVSSSDWFSEDVNFVVRNGLMTGTGDAKFDPNITMTRGMLVTVLYRFAGQPSTMGGNGFSDVDGSQYYAPAVAWAAENDIVTGIGEGLFAPNSEITRQDLAVILYKFGGGSAPSTPLRFDDAADVSDYARDAVALCAEMGIIRGKDGNIFAPGGKATRAEAAAMLRRFIESTD